MKVTIVVQRYGPTIVGGAEALARAMAHMLARWHEVTVVTTAASDSQTWRNDLPAGQDRDGPIRILRFPVESERMQYWHELNRLLLGEARGETFVSLPRHTKELFRERLEKWSVALQEEYIRWQGPYPPELFQWLSANADFHDRFVFFTYLYPTTYFGMTCVPPAKVDFLPTLHDEPSAYLSAFGRCFRIAQRVLCSTYTERRLAQRLYALPADLGEILGYGLKQPPSTSDGSPPDEPFLLYAGRLEVNKGVLTLIEYFIRWKEANRQSPLRLILIGKRLMDLPTYPAIEYRGFVSEEEKGRLFRQAVALVHPSPLESLGLVILEAFLCGTPVLVLETNEVLVDHCRFSNGGLWYEDYDDFAAALSWLLAHPDEARRLGAQGQAYAQERYGLANFQRRLAAIYPPDR